MNFSVGQIVVVLVIVAAVGATVFRVSTGPDRARQRRDIARQVCLDAGGRWLLEGQDEVCQKSGAAP